MKPLFSFTDSIDAPLWCTLSGYLGPNPTNLFNLPLLHGGVVAESNVAAIAAAVSPATSEPGLVATSSCLPAAASSSDLLPRLPPAIMVEIKPFVHYND
uniref:Uncharacterized protein n=1 Tax=Cucumis melo TaxID=3656 RepID=A0A9I9EDM0_CUCME